MRTFLTVLLLALPLTLSAQLRESIEVSVLELDVVVLDRDGKSVDGLTSDDFEVEIGKRRAGVTNFYAVKRGAIVDEHPAGSPRRAGVSGETLLPTTVVVFIDDTRLTQHAKARAIDALKEYVAANVGPATSAMLVRWNGRLDVRTRPAERAGPLIAELEKMAKEPAMLNDSERRHILKTIDEAMLGITGHKYAHSVQNAWIRMIGYADREAREVDQTLDALREVTRLAGAFEGRKSLLYISEGLPLQPAADLFEYWDRMTRARGVEGLDADLMETIARNAGGGYNQIMDGMRYDRSRRYHELSRQAQALNVPFYAIDVGGARGLATPGVEEIHRIAQISTTAFRANLQDGVRMLAHETGGRFIANENDLGRALAVVSEQFDTYYSLGVRASASTRLAKVSVKVKARPELRVVAARHRKPLTRDEQIERAVRSRLYLAKSENPHGAEVAVGTAANLAGRCVVPVNVFVPRAKIVPAGGAQTLKLHFALLDELNQESDVRTTPVPLGPGDLSHPLTIGVRPGRYVLSLAVSDPSTGVTSYLRRDIDASGCR
ncbi:MAG TPA: VWA domain-containing protein [Thermoanaerobaculia bacterium]|nr:VWA domain-containing protein [Thermoanaerobaculia bacterium]